MLLRYLNHDIIWILQATTDSNFLIFLNVPSLAQMACVVQFLMCEIVQSA